MTKTAAVILSFGKCFPHSGWMETTGFFFYVTDSTCSYPVVFNDHDVLMTCGLLSS
jgi:hypothetical protein